MADEHDILISEIKCVVDDSIKPLVQRVRNLEITTYGEDWSGGLKSWANRQNGYLKGISLMLKIGIPIVAGINLVILAAIFGHMVR